MYVYNSESSDTYRQLEQQSAVPIWCLLRNLNSLAQKGFSRINQILQNLWISIIIERTIVQPACIKHLLHGSNMKLIKSTTVLISFLR